MPDEGFPPFPDEVLDTLEEGARSHFDGAVVACLRAFQIRLANLERWAQAMSDREKEEAGE